MSIQEIKYRMYLGIVKRMTSKEYLEAEEVFLKAVAPPQEAQE